MKGLRGVGGLHGMVRPGKEGLWDQLSPALLRMEQGGELWATGYKEAKETDETAGQCPRWPITDLGTGVDRRSGGDPSNGPHVPASATYQALDWALDT